MKTNIEKKNKELIKDMYSNEKGQEQGSINSLGFIFTIGFFFLAFFAYYFFDSFS